jgi:hypothetical protein
VKNDVFFETAGEILNDGRVFGVEIDQVDPYKLTSKDF